MTGNAEIITKIVNKIKSEYQPEKIILYGSYAYGKPDRNSDIDLLIIKETDERPIDRRIQVRKIADIRLAIAFSPFVMTSKEIKYCLNRGDQFIEEIMNKGKVLYEK